jgi:hypothetical protein
VDPVGPGGVLPPLAAGHQHTAEGGAYREAVDLSRPAQTLLRLMADEAPSLDVTEAADLTGLSVGRMSLAMRELHDASYVKEHTSQFVRVVERRGVFDITAAGRRASSRLG